MGMGMAVIWR